MPKISELVAKALRQKGDAVNGEGVTGEGYGRFLIDYVISGAVLTNNATSVMVSAATISFETDLYDVPETTLPVLHGQLNKTLYVDFTPEFGFRLATAHPTIGYLPLYELVTDASGNVASFTDKRGPVGEIRYRPEFPGIISDSRSINAGSGLTGGGNLKQDRTISIADGGVTDTHIGNRTADQTIGTAAANNGTLTQFISWIAKQLKAITGAPNWYDAPTTTIASLDADKAPLASPGFTGTPTAPTPALEDSSTALATTEFVKTQPGFLTADDKAKLAGISAGAEVNQNAFSKIAVSGQPDVDADAKTDAFTLAGGAGITITTNATDTVTITATGEAVPGPHAATHITGGLDVIPGAVAGGDSGLMSGADKSKLDGIQAGAEVNQDLAAGANITLTPDANTVTIAVSGLAAVATSGNASDLTEDASNRFVSDTEKAAWNAKAETTDLVAANPTAATMSPGVQIINSTRKSRLKTTKMTGRTLVNRMGRTSSLTAGGVVALTPAAGSKVSISSGVNVKPSSATSEGYVSLNNPDGSLIAISGPKKGVLIADIRINSIAAGTGVINLAYSGIAVQPIDMTKIGAWQTVGIRLDIAGDAVNNVFVGTCYQGANGIQGDFDVKNWRVFEVTQAQYDALNGKHWDAAYLNTNFPYVDDVKSVNAVYAQNPGKNLLPPFSEWSAAGTGQLVFEAYKAAVAATGANMGYTVEVPCSPNQTYILSVTNDATVAIQTLDKDKAIINSFGGKQQLQTKTITTEANAVYLSILLTNGALANGTYTFDKPMLTVGSAALPFEPQKPSYMYLPDVQLRSNVDGSVADMLFIRDGQPRAIRRFREMVLDGSLAWGNNASANGVRRVNVNLSPKPWVDYSGVVVKYDGKILKNNGNVAPIGSTDSFLLWSDGNIFVDTTSSDTGFGDTYTPTAAEIQAYFYGWVMMNADGTPYTTGTKYWQKVYCGVGTPSTLPNGTKVVGVSQTTLPVTMNDQGYTPYRTTYQLAQSYEDAVSYEGDLFLHDGANQIEVGTGVVVREAANPVLTTAASWNINNWSPSAKLKRRTGKILGVFKDGIRNLWQISPHTDASAQSTYGAQLATIPDAQFDKAASYAVTYLALDTYALGIAPASISAEYAPNVKEALDDIALAVAHTRTQVSALQTTKAQKQAPGWIQPTLLNGWTNYDTTRLAGYSKDDVGTVRLHGFIKGGTVGSPPVFYLPQGFRPSYEMNFSIVANSALGMIVIYPSGHVAFANGSNVWVELSQISFRAEQ